MEPGEGEGGGGGGSEEDGEYEGRREKGEKIGER